MTAESAQVAKGIKPSTPKQARRAEPSRQVGHGRAKSAPHLLCSADRVGHGHNTPTPSRCAHSDTLTPPQISPHHAHHTHASSAAETNERTNTNRPIRPHPATMGDTATKRAGGGEAHIGGVANTQTARLRSRRPRVGDRVVNASGRGMWRVGVVVAVIPAGTSPAAWCSRNGFPALFRKRTAPGIRERYIVAWGGSLFTPEKVILYGN